MYIFRLSTPLQISQIRIRRTSNVNTAAMPVVTVNTYLEKKCFIQNSQVPVGL
jgi:hypothetical protein